MKLGYIFGRSLAAIFKSTTMIWLRIKSEIHRAHAIGMIVFADNPYNLQRGAHPSGRWAERTNDILVVDVNDVLAYPEFPF